MEQDEKAKTGLAEWLAGGLRATMRAGEIPPSLVSYQRCQKIMIDMDDGMLMEAATRAGVSDGPTLRELANSVPDLDATLSTSEYQAKAREYFAQTRSAVVLRALDRAAMRLDSACRRGQLPTAPAVIYRNIFALALLAYLPGNEGLKSQLAAILGCSVSGTDRGILEFVKLAVKGDADKVTTVDEAISADSAWDNWPSDFLNRVRAARDMLEVVPDGRNKAAWEALWNKLLE